MRSSSIRQGGSTGREAASDGGCPVVLAGLTGPPTSHSKASKPRQGTLRDENTRLGYRVTLQRWGDALIPLGSQMLTQGLHEIKTLRLQLREAIPWLWGRLRSPRSSGLPEGVGDPWDE